MPHPKTSAFEDVARSMSDITFYSRYVKTNGVRLHSIQAGSDANPLIILLHGFPEFWYGWRSQIGSLASGGFHVMAPDQRGYNLSDKPQGMSSYAIDELAGDVLGLADFYKRDQFYLAGHDWGAAVAWHIAMNYPSRLHKLAILNVPHPDIMLRFITTNPIQILKSWYIFFFQLPLLPELSMRLQNFSAASRMLVRTGKPGTFTQREIEHYKVAWSQPNALTGMINWYRAIFRSNLRLGFKPIKAKPQRVTVPTMLLWGKRDIALSYEMALASIELCDQGELVTYNDATHWLQHDEADSISSHLKGFFSEI